MKIQHINKQNFTPYLFRQKGRGFTLIELLVVISVISLLATLAISSLKNAQMKSRDAKRKSDLVQIRKALDLYFDDNNSYPPSPCGYNCNGYYYSYNSSWDTFAAFLAPYMAQVPVDPINETGYPWNGYHSYTYGNSYDASWTLNPNQYDLTAALENTSDPDRCAIKQYYFFRDRRPWCGPGSGQIFEASPDQLIID